MLKGEECGQNCFYKDLTDMDASIVANATNNSILSFLIWHTHLGDVSW